MMNPNRKERQRPALSPTNRYGVTVPPSALESIANRNQYLIVLQLLEYLNFSEKGAPLNGISWSNFLRIINKSKLLTLAGRKIIFYGVSHAFTAGQLAHKAILRPYSTFDHFNRVCGSRQIAGILA